MPRAGRHRHSPSSVSRICFGDPIPNPNPNPYPNPNSNSYQINTIFDPIMMFTLGLGMAGAAGATALAQFCGTLVCLFYIISLYITHIFIVICSPKANPNRTRTLTLTLTEP